MSETAHLLGMFVRATRASRVLEIGTGAAITGLAMAEALPDNGMLITLERNHSTAVIARQAFATAGYAQKTSVMIGDAARYLHKMAGPFDLIFQNGDVTDFEALHERLVRLLAPSATLITHNIRQAASYNRALLADTRLTTMTLNVGLGVAISVKTR